MDSEGSLCLGPGQRRIDMLIGYFEMLWLNNVTTDKKMLKTVRCLPVFLILSCKKCLKKSHMSNVFKNLRVDTNLWPILCHTTTWLKIRPTVEQKSCLSIRISVKIPIQGQPVVLQYETFTVYDI